jgi:hypothetical protein
MNIINNEYLTLTIFSYLQLSEVYPKCLRVSQRVKRFMAPRWENVKVTNEEFINKKRNYDRMEEIKRNNPPIKVSIKLWNCSAVNLVLESCQTITFYFRLYPIYPQHHAGIRFSRDNWQSYEDINAEWLFNNNNCEEWKVTIVNRIEDVLKPIHYVLFAKDVLGNWYWDNNNGWNFHLVPPRSGWVYHFN